MSNALAITLHEQEQESASGTGESVDIESLRTAAWLTLRVLDLSGTLTVELQTSPDDTNWVTIWSSASVAANSDVEFAWAGLKRYVRCKWTLSALGTATFEFVGDAHVVYVKPLEVSRYSRGCSLGKFDPSDIAHACIVASSKADDSLNGSFELPLTSWGESLRAHCGYLVAAELGRQRKLDPEGLEGKILYGAETEAFEWFARIRAGKLKPPDIVDSTPTVFEGASVCVTPGSRGW